MTRRVVVTGMAGVTPFGNNWEEVGAALKRGRNAVVRMEEWDEYKGLRTRLAAPVEGFEVPGHYTRKQLRSMGRVSRMATVASELALAQAGLLDHPVLTSGETGIAYGSSTPSPQSVNAFSMVLQNKVVRQVNANTYLKMMPHTAAVNVGLFFGLKGRLIPTSCACASGSQAIGYAFETIREGKQKVMVAGGGEELCVTEVVVFDTMHATSRKNDTPHLSPSPFDADRDGLVIGEGAGTLVLEELEHARERGAAIHGEVVGFATNCDAAHITQPNPDTIQVCMESSLEDAGLEPGQIGYISAHGTSTHQGDTTESHATHRVFGDRVPVSSLKSYFGHSLGACGSVEAWLALEMMKEDWFAPNVNLSHVDPHCASLDYIRGEGRSMEVEHLMSNNFAFGGVNTSLIFRRWNP